MAIDIYDEIISRKTDDLESFYQKGICMMNLKDYEIANACFIKANTIRIEERT